MTIRQQVRRHQDEQLAKERALARKLATAYGEMWQRIKAQLASMVADYQSAQDDAENGDGEEVDASWLYASQRLSEAQHIVRHELEAFMTVAAPLLLAGALRGIQDGLADAADLVGGETGLLDLAKLTLEATAKGSVADAVFRLGGPILDKAVQRASNSLVRSVAVGRSTADLWSNLRNEIATGLNQTLGYARDTSLDAYRLAAGMVYRTHGLDWAWLAEVGACPICVEEDGSVHPYDEDFASLHNHCRCQAVPILESGEQDTNAAYTD